MIILKSKLEKLLKIEREETAVHYQSKIDRLTKELEEAKNFKALIERLASPINITSGSSGGVLSFSGGYDPLSSNHEIQINVKDNVATLVNDELSKEIIVKQQSTKIVFLNKDGGIEKTGYTKQKPDKGFSYKLVRN